MRRAPLLVAAAVILFLVSLLLQAGGPPDRRLDRRRSAGATSPTLFATRALTVSELKALARREPPEAG